MRAPGIGGHPWVHLKAPPSLGGVPTSVYFPVHSHQPPQISKPDAPHPRERYFIHLSGTPGEVQFRGHLQEDSPAFYCENVETCSKADRISP